MLEPGRKLRTGLYVKFAALRTPVWAAGARLVVKGVYESMPFFAAAIVVLLLVTYVPAISLLIPRLLG